jgi:hypothetical protein
MRCDVRARAARRPPSRRQSRALIALALTACLVGACGGIQRRSPETDSTVLAAQDDVGCGPALLAAAAAARGPLDEPLGTSVESLPRVLPNRGGYNAPRGRTETERDALLGCLSPRGGEKRDR